MWPPFVKQCIAMVRDHEHNYVRGPGYNQDDHGSVTERCASATLRRLAVALPWCFKVCTSGIRHQLQERPAIQWCCDPTPGTLRLTTSRQWTPEPGRPTSWR